MIFKTYAYLLFHSLHESVVQAQLFFFFFFFNIYLAALGLSYSGMQDLVP